MLKKIINAVSSKIINRVKNSPEFRQLKDDNFNSVVSEKSKLYSTYKIYNSKVDDYTYIAQGAIIRFTEIGKFCSIGANLVSGWGIHPIKSLSTSPMFYSTQKQNGFSLSDIDKIEETKSITIGNDVFIGMNVTILDGVSIGDGAVIGAGAVVSKDIPPYAIAVGCPIQIKGYRFDDNTIAKLLEIKWWNWNDEKLKNVEIYFDNIGEFILKFR